MSWIQGLARRLPPGRVAADRASRIAYSYDATYRRHLPEAVVFPRSTDEVAEVLRFSYREGVPVFPRGGGTGLAGGSVPLGGIALVTLDMNRVLWVDRANLQMRVEAGVVTAAVQRAAAERGLFYPVDPGSARVGTIGGNIALDAGGSRSFQYGTTRRYVLGLTVVLPDGTIVETGGRTARNATGLDLTHLFVGSEGILGVVTEATLRLLPPPEASASLQAAFLDLEACARTIETLAGSTARPTALEFLDRTSLDVVSAVAALDLPPETAALLLLRVEGRREAVERQARELAALLEEGGGRQVRVAAAAEEQARLWEVRHAVSPAVARIKPTKIAEDATVPLSAVPSFIRMVHGLRREFGVAVVLFGHAGDGNFHPNFLCDSRDPDEMARVERAVAALFERTLALGGTLSGEHGTGMLKAPFLARAVSPANLALQRALKATIDPKNLLNPGKLLPAAEGAAG